MAHAAGASSRRGNLPELLPLDTAFLPPTDPIPTTTTTTAAPARRTTANGESVAFIWLDSVEQSSLNVIGSLRAMNDNVQTFHDPVSCLKTMKSSNEKIFVLTTLTNGDLISKIHQLNAVEFIFILDSNVESIKGDFPKLVGIFKQHEELFRVAKEIFETFEQIQLEQFEFENEKSFLWTQLWKEDVNRFEF